MQMKKLFAGDPTAPDVSVVGLGCNNFGMRIDEAQTGIVVNKALDAGINFFDTAEMYGGGGVSEEYLGKALGSRRGEILLTTKFGYAPPNGSREHIMESIEGSLKRLGTDYLDLYQIHKPDPDTPIEETLEAMDSLVQQGKVRYIGCSNYSAAQLDEARAASAKGGFAPYVTAQNGHSLLNREVEDALLPACRKHGVGFIPFFPLESGLLTGKYQRGVAAPEGTRLSDERFAGRFSSDERFDVVEKLEAFAKEQGHTLLELAMSWLVSKPEVVCVIAGATKPDQIDANIAAARWQLSEEEFAQVDALTRAPQPA
jgi:aryl-alcohol dehydrogenase-like predicted oxidoreductase